MPTSVSNAFTAASLVQEGVVRWGTTPPESASGVYIVSLTNSLIGFSDALVKPPLSRPVFKDWLSVCPDLKLDGDKPTVDQLMARVGQFWLSDEVILYIGKATSLSTRLGQYYRTPIGARGPHSGGYFLKLLLNLPELWVHYARTNNPHSDEDTMLRSFTESVSDKSKSVLHDPDHPFSFANLEWPQGTIKNHGLRGTRVSNMRTVPGKSKKHRQTESINVSPPTKVIGQHPTQRVTAADLRGGRIRIPSTNATSTKRLFPPSKSRVKLILRGRTIECSWNPRMGPDRQRSGVLQIGAVLRELVGADEVLTVTQGDKGATNID